MALTVEQSGRWLFLFGLAGTVLAEWFAFTR